MFKKIILCAMTMFMAYETYAVQLTPQEALARLKTDNLQAKGMDSSNASMQLAYTSSLNGTNTYYVFNKAGNGYVILSADDCMPAVLGIVEGSNFDYDMIPDNMKWWLGQYDQSIRYYSTTGKKYAPSAKSAKRKDIAPLLGGIAWNQDEPFNNMCPQYNGNRAYTGCVATAMAQIMRMHKWPKTGTGKNKYDCDFKYDYNNPELYKTITLEEDFSKSTYQWDKMPEKISDIRTNEQKAAISKLMYDCGVATEMDYAVTGSAALSDMALKAFILNFNYDENAQLLYRMCYTPEEWDNMLYESLSNGLPVYNSGITHEYVGHAFVCDGYSAADNLFHFNWGWGGYDNGYFLTYATFTNENENDMPYPFQQCAIFNLKPATKPYVEDNKNKFIVYEPHYVQLLESEEKVDKIYRINNAKIRSDHFLMQYMGLEYNQYTVAVKLHNEKNEYIVHQFTHDYYFRSCFEALDLFPSEVFKNGKYTITIMYKDALKEDTWHEVKYEDGVKKPVIEIVGDEPDFYLADELKLSYNGKTIKDREITVNPKAKNIDIQLKVKALKDFSDQTITMFLEGNDYDAGYYFSEEKEVSIPASSEGETKTITISYPYSNLKPGALYFLHFYKKVGDTVYDIAHEKFSWREFIIVDAPTGIESITQDDKKDSPQTIYTINGMNTSATSLDELPSGLYIINGKKVVK